MPSRWCILAGAAALLATGAADAQQPQRRGLEPVEQVIADREPLRRSLRRVYQGLGTDGQGSFVYRRRSTDPADTARTGDRRKLYFISRGVVAEFDRSQYTRDREGRLLQEIPPNTVFHLGGVPETKQGENKPPAPTHRPGQLRARIDGRLDAQAGARPPRRSAARSAQRRAQRQRRFELWRFRQAQQRAVIAAIDRHLRPSSDPSTPSPAAPDRER